VSKFGASTDVISDAGPFLFSADDYVYMGNNVLQPWTMAKSELERMNKYYKWVFILDNSGNRMIVSSFEEVVPRSRLGKAVRRVSPWTRATPKIVKSTKLTLDEFKSYIRKALTRKQRYDTDYGIPEDAMKKLMEAKSYSEALACVPQPL